MEKLPIKICWRFFFKSKVKTAELIVPKICELIGGDVSLLQKYWKDTSLVEVVINEILTDELLSDDKELVCYLMQKCQQISFSWDFTLPHIHSTYTDFSAISTKNFYLKDIVWVSIGIST